LLPAPPLAAVCRDNRLANWVHGSESWAPEKAIPGRLKRAADAYGLRLHLTRRLHGLAARRATQPARGMRRLLRLETTRPK